MACVAHVNSLISTRGIKGYVQLCAENLFQHPEFYIYITEAKTEG